MVGGSDVIDEKIALHAMEQMEIDQSGLDSLDRRLLSAVIEMYSGGPVGIETLAAALGEEAVTLEDVCEPYLMQKGFLTRTPRGRCVTHLAYRHLDIALPAESPAASNQQTLEELLAGGEL